MRPVQQDELLTLAAVQAEIAHIGALDDFEHQHALEDALLKQFVMNVANGLLKGSKCQEIATELLSLEELDFPRHCA